VLRFLYVVSLFLLTGWLTAVAAIAPLTLGQLLRLIANQTPDRIVAAEISDRGIRETIDKTLVDSVRKAGAGIATLAVLEKIRPKSTLAISGIPGTNIALDGISVGRIAETGKLVLRDLWPGRHEVTGDLYEHTPTSELITLTPNRNSELELRLKSFYGLVSVKTNASQPTIEISGLSRFRGPLLEQRVRAGKYELKVEAPYREPHTETIEIVGGESIERDIVLTVDRRELDQLLGRMRQGFTNRNYRTTVDDAKAYLEAAIEGDLSRVYANSLLALSLMELRSFPDAIAAGLKAIDLGGTLTFDVMHHHGFIQPHRASIAVSEYKLQYDPLETCTVSKGSIDVGVLTVSMDVTARLPGMGTRIQPGSAVTVKFPKPTKPSDTITLNFIDADVQRADAIFRFIQAAGARRRAALSSAITVAPSEIPGKYWRNGFLGDYIELKADGTLVLQQQGKTFSGTYSVAGNVLSIKANNRTDTGRFDGTKLVDSQGDFWQKSEVKQH
jgi:hypothetical protein